MKTRIAMVLAVLFVIGFVVSVEAAEVKASSELSISSAPEAASVDCAEEGCPKKAECKKRAECKKKAECKKSDKAGCSKAKSGCSKGK
jgi:hypothetical protein